MKKSAQFVFLLFNVSMALVSSCTSVPTSTSIPLTFAPSLVPPTFAPESTATRVPASNPFVSSWTQIILSDHPLGMAVCGNFQNVEFFDDGTFTVTNDYSGVYKEFGPGFGTPTPSGTYNILREKQLEIKYASDSNVTEWEYVFAGSMLTMSSPAPDELGGGLIACYSSKSSK